MIQKIVLRHCSHNRITQGHKLYDSINRMVMTQTLGQKASCIKIYILKYSKYATNIKISQNIT